MMKYLVMENHESHSIVMDESGIFHRVANLGYEVGDTITEPIFMKSPEKRKNTNYKKITTIAAIFVCFIMASIPFINNYNQSDVIVYMSINPEVHIELSEDGMVNKLVADNEDGKTLLKGYKHRGKSVSSVLIELIDRANRLEFLSEGGNIRITVEAGDEIKAERVTADLSNELKNVYLKKYLIKIRTNQNAFHEVNEETEVESIEPESEQTEKTYAYSENTSVSEQVVTEPSYNNSNNKGTEENDPTEPASDEPTQSTEPTEPEIPEVKPTKPSTSDPTVTEPSEETTETISTSEPTVEDDKHDEEDTVIDEEDDDEDWVWPWAP